MLNKPASFFVSLYIWLFIVFSIVPLFVVYFLLWVLTRLFDKRQAVVHYYAMIWSRLYLLVNPGWKIRVENRDRIEKGKTYILISNHQSIIDIALLLQLNVNFRWVSKIELARVPVVGWVLWLNNHIMVRRGDKLSVVQMAEACRKVIASGVSVCVFPEGTRSVNGNLQPFKEGAFILAKDNNTTILPVVIDGASEALPRNAFWFKVRQTFTVRVLDEIPVEDIRHTSADSLASHASQLMTDELQHIRNCSRIAD